MAHMLQQVGVTWQEPTAKDEQKTEKEAEEEDEKVKVEDYQAETTNVAKLVLGQKVWYKAFVKGYVSGYPTSDENVCVRLQDGHWYVSRDAFLLQRPSIASSGCYFFAQTHTSIAQKMCRGAWMVSPTCESKPFTQYVSGLLRSDETVV